MRGLSATTQAVAAAAQAAQVAQRAQAQADNAASTARMHDHMASQAASAVRSLADAADAIGAQHRALSGKLAFAQARLAAEPGAQLLVTEEQVAAQGEVTQLQAQVAAQSAALAEVQRALEKANSEGQQHAHAQAQAQQQARRLFAEAARLQERAEQLHAAMGQLLGGRGAAAGQLPQSPFLIPGPGQPSQQQRQGMPGSSSGAAAWTQPSMPTLGLSQGPGQAPQPQHSGSSRGLVVTTQPPGSGQQPQQQGGITAAPQDTLGAGATSSPPALWGALSAAGMLLAQAEQGAGAGPPDEDWQAQACASMGWNDGNEFDELSGLDGASM
jgi:hypothetical protein